MVASLNNVAVLEVPGALAGGLVVFELSFVVVTVGEYPLSLNQLVFMPFSGESHGRLVENVSALAVLLAVAPLSGVHVLVGIGIEPLSVLLALFELACINLLVP